MGRGIPTVVGSIIDYWKDLGVERAEKFLGYVILAQRVLEPKIELIGPRDFVCQAAFVSSCTVSLIATFSEYIHVNIPLEFSDVALPVAFCAAVTHNPSYITSSFSKREL